MLSVFGGVSGKGSLAKERNSSTFLSNLVRTTLACFLPRVPRKSVRHTRKKRQAGRTEARQVPRAGMLCGEAITPVL